jgi:4-amino-4-deoxy-L-arabinose transferase-like glycosyltransferase
MTHLPFLLPILSFAGLLVAFWGRSARPGAPRLGDWRPSFLRAAIVWGGLLVLISEGLSLVGGLSQAWVAFGWGVVLGTLLWDAWRRRTGRAVMQQLRSTSFRMGWPDGMLLAGVGIVSGLLFAVAWMSPASNVDSLLYHMSRVVHWAQNHSLAHYPTVYAHQLLKPIWAEMAILDLRLLWGNDRVAALVQWFSMVGSLVGASWIAAVLGARLRGQLLAALFALSIPMGILQSTSTQNDYVVAFWAVCLMALVVEGKRPPQAWVDKGLIALVTGLGVLTKGTFFVYVIPLLAWHFLPKLWREKPKAWLAEGALVALVVVMCNAGFWARNVVTYGGPYGPSDWLTANLTFLQVAPSPPVTVPAQPPTATLDVPEPGAGVGDGPAATSQSPRIGLVTRIGGGLARMIAFNQVTPAAALNAPILALLHRYPQVFGEDFFADLATIAWNHEDTAGNPLHLLLIVVSFVLVFLIPRARRSPSLIPAALVVLATYLMIPLVIGHGPSIWGLRYQLPFFVLWAPVFGVAVGEHFKGWIGWAIGLGLFLASLPWVLLNNTRPVIGLPPWPTRTESVFVEDPSRLAFAIMAGSRDPGKREAILAATDIVRSRECKAVGLVVDSGGLEYLYWWALQAPQSGIRMENLNPLPESERYNDPAFQPCIVLCTLCTDREVYKGLPMITDFSGVRVFGAEVR